MIRAALLWPIGSEEELEIVGKLHHFDSMRWSDIEGTDHHSIDIDKLSKEAKKGFNKLTKMILMKFFFSFCKESRELFVYAIDTLRNYFGLIKITKFVHQRKRVLK